MNGPETDHDGVEIEGFGVRLLTNATFGQLFEALESQCGPEAVEEVRNEINIMTVDTKDFIDGIEQESLMDKNILKTLGDLGVSLSTIEQKLHVRFV